MQHDFAFSLVYCLAWYPRLSGFAAWRGATPREFRNFPEYGNAYLGRILTAISLSKRGTGRLSVPPVAVRVRVFWIRPS